jgi:hypothetical protein
MVGLGIMLCNSDVQEVSIIKIAIFRRSKLPLSNPQVISVGEVLLPARDITFDNRDTIGV